MKPHKDFVHLHAHTQYSLLDGACKTSEMIEKACEMGFPALAVTDHGNLFGAIEFYEEAMTQGIKPIIGIEAYIAPTSRFDRSNHGIKEASYHLTLLARNEKGYKNLMKLSTLGYLEGFYYRPRMDKEILKQYSEGLVGLSGCLKGEIPHFVLNGQFEEAERVISEYQEILGKENFYLEIYDHGIDEQKKLVEGYLQLKRNLEIPFVATNDVHYIFQSQYEAHDALLCIGTGTTVDDPNRMRYATDQFYLKSAEEMKSLFDRFPGAIENSIVIASRCNLELDFKKTYLPRFDPPHGRNKEEYLRELCQEGLRKHFGEPPEAYLRRLMEELSIINSMRYSSYFLIVWDFIRYAREQGIPVGPGRGSAAGSLVAYALGITDIDPLQHGLIFERFLNPDRISMPDIDIDFCYERRDEVIDYVKKKYGQDNVSQIITFGTMMARAVIRDVGRVMGMSYQEVDRIAKLIPNELNITIDEALRVEPRLAQLMTEDPRVQKLIEISKSLEGLARHASTHAAGVVISDAPLTEYTPLFKTGDQVTTQYPMGALEKIGLLKMDFLGLKTLTVISHTLRLLKENRGMDIAIGNIPFDDPKTYELLSRGETFGVFQLESSGMRDILRRLKPNKFEDIVALLALYRPGPLGSGMVDDFIRRRHDPSLIKYDHPALEPLLKETYGVILYQEQVMQIVSQLAGFSLAQADSLRRAIGKKIPEVMDKEKRSFLEGAKKKGVVERIAERIWNLIEYFAGYGFNKSHSAAYSFISYQTAYLKANYPHEFMAALLTSEKDNTDKIVRHIEEAKRLGILLLPPDVNESSAEFITHEGKIRFGLSAVKNVGQAAIDSILSARRERGPFRSFFDFTERADLRVCNRKVLESLIKAGAFDCFRLKRSQLVVILDRALEIGSSIQKDREKGQLSFFDSILDAQQGIDQETPEIDEWPENQLLSSEREVLGFYITAHPLSRFERILKKISNASCSTLSEFRDQDEVSIGGMINGVKEIVTKKGERMAFIVLEDLTGSCEAVIFPELYRSEVGHLYKDSRIFLKGRVNLREDQPKIIASEILPLEEVKDRFTRGIAVDLVTTGLNPETLGRLRDICRLHKGNTPLYLEFKDPAGKFYLLSPGDDFKVETSDSLFRSIEDLVGENSVKIRS